jgi:signal transduction histidine kinase/CheY-like chemotaxis protein
VQPDNRIQVLHTDDNTNFLDLTATYLEQESDQLIVETKESVDEALECLTSNAIDCIVSDYDMPEKDGIEFLRAVRQNYPDKPFILFTGKGSEEIAGEAISAGVTDYLQKGGTEKYELLANRIERAASEARLQERRRNMGQDPLELLEQLDDPLYALDENCAFTYVNEAATGLFEMSEEKLLDNCIWELFPEIKNTDFYRHCGRAIDTDVAEPYTVEAPFEPRGTWYRKYLYPNENGVMIISKEVTKEKQQEVSLQRHQKLLERVEDLTDVGGFEADIQTGEQIWTDGTYRIHDLDPEGEFDPTVDDAFRFYHPDDQEIIEQAVEQCISEGISYEKELRIITDNDRNRWVRTYGVPLEEDGEVTHIQGAAEDITEQKRRESQLRDKNERLEEFASVVSHDLRNPLKMATTRLELVQQECDSTHLDKIEKAHHRMDALIEDLLELAREGKQVNETELFDLSELVEQSWDTVVTTDATLKLNGDGQIRADPTRLRQLLENLYENAIEHGGDEVTVAVGLLDDGFYIKDDGAGISEDIQEDVFKPGYSTVADGTGFGLNIIKQIVEAHGWSISLTEDSDGGARFEITGVEFAE